AVVVAAVIRVLTDRDVGGAVGRRVHPLIGGVAASVTADRPAVGTQPGGVVGRGRDRLRAVGIFRLGGLGVLLFVLVVFLGGRGLGGGVVLVLRLVDGDGFLAGAAVLGAREEPPQATADQREDEEDDECDQPALAGLLLLDLLIRALLVALLIRSLLVALPVRRSLLETLLIGSLLVALPIRWPLLETLLIEALLVRALLEVLTLARPTSHRPCRGRAPLVVRWLRRVRQPRAVLPGVRRTQVRVGGLLAGVPRRVGGRRRGLVGARLLGARLVGAWLALSPRIIRGLIPWVLRLAVAG